MFSCQFANQFGSEIGLPSDLRIEPQWYSHGSAGGPLQADINVYGELDQLWKVLQWLAWRVTVRNSHWSKAWWGYVEEVLIFDGYQMHGLSLKNMYNRVRLAYVYELFGAPATGVTAWAEDAASIAALGLTKEREQTQAITTSSPTSANSARDTLLAQSSLPPPISGGGNGGEPYAVLRCAGYIYSLEWLYYSQIAGLEANENGGSDQVMGQGLTDTTIGFTSGGKIHDLTGRFGDDWVVGSNIQVSDTSDNNISAVITAVDNRQPVQMSTANISFEATDDITDSTYGALTYMQPDDIISVTGTSSSNGVRRVKSADAEHVVVRGGSYTGESGPPNGIITRGTWIQVDSGIATDTNEEFPGGSVTIIVHGTKIAQSITNHTGVDWTIANVEIPIRRVGNPTDNVALRLMTNSAAGQPGTQIAISTVAGTDVGEDSGIETFAFANPPLFQTGVTYWLEMYRSGPKDYDDYYVVEVDEGSTYGGTFLVHNGNGYLGRSPNANLRFRILGAWETTEQIRQIALATGQLLAGVDIQQRSNLFTHQYRAGGVTGYDEIMALLEAGTFDGRRLLATITSDRYLRIRAQDARTNANYQYRAGEFLDIAGQALEDGFMPVGQWVKMAGVPPTASAYNRLSPKFLAEARYDCRTGQIEPLWQGEPSPWED